MLTSQETHRLSYPLRSLVDSSSQPPPCANCLALLQYCFRLVYTLQNRVLAYLTVPIKPSLVSIGIMPTYFSPSTRMVDQNYTLDAAEAETPPIKPAMRILSLFSHRFVAEEMGDATVLETPTRSREMVRVISLPSRGLVQAHDLRLRIMNTPPCTLTE